MFSLTNARQRLYRLYSWFHRPQDTMKNFDTWAAIINRHLLQPIDHSLFHFTIAASDSNDPGIVLDRLEVTGMWLNKDPEPPEHEYLVVETKDSQDSQSRLFVLHRTVQMASQTPSAPKGQAAEKDPPPLDPGSYLPHFILSPSLPHSLSYLLPHFILSPSLLHSLSRSRSRSPLSLMEEGAASASTATSTPTPTKTTPTHTHHPPLSFPTPQHSMGDAFSLASARSSQQLSDSFRKGDRIEALDQILGEGIFLGSRYSRGHIARQIKPQNLKLFELLVLAQAVHEFAPQYSVADRNCYWFGNIILDAVIEIFGLDTSVNPGDGGREASHVQIDPHRGLAGISGCWLGYRVTETQPQDLLQIIQGYKEAVPQLISKVKSSFSNLPLLAKLSIGRPSSPERGQRSSRPSTTRFRRAQVPPFEAREP
jgi:hypothetical protein